MIRLMNKQKPLFFPRDVGFWSYHWVCVSLLLLSHSVLAALFLNEFFVFNIVGFILWLPLFSLAVLSFRYLYKIRCWSNLSVNKLIVLAFSFSLVSSFIITLLVLLSMAPLFLSNFVIVDSFYNSTVSYTEFVSVLIGLVTLQSHIFMSAWIFIYVSATSNRKIHETELSNLRLENSLKEAKISSLSNQINPHLLFNTLNDIRFMIYENPIRADEMITSFSDILRYSLRKTDSEKVGLGEEWDIVLRYIEVVEVKYDEKIRFEVEMEPGLDKCLVPPMALQILLENAIKHGLDQVENGRLSLSAVSEGDLLNIKVVNTKPKKPRLLNPGAGIGLNNIRQRLHLLYEGRADLKTYEDDGEFSAILSLPKEC